MKKVFILAFMALLCNVSMANDIQVTASETDSKVEVYSFVDENGTEISSESSSLLEAFLGETCVTVTASAGEGDDIVTAEGTCCSNVSAIAEICASNRADHNLNIRLSNQQ